ncbi:hypothetical protein J3459_011133 [Metarhizium acridum]|nr:hypothetical protein J3459_011133 [Metarhizium acridum]
MAIEIESSPLAAPKEEPIENDGPGNKPAGAPIPDMGMGLGLDLGMSDLTPAYCLYQGREYVLPAPIGVHAGGPGPVKTESKESNYEAPIAPMDVTLEGTQANIGGG